MDLGAFHFLRPLWLLLVLPGILLPYLWKRQRNATGAAGIIAPHLLPYLLVSPAAGRRLHPVHLLSALLILGGLATAGPTWEQDRPEFLDDRAPLILALDLSASMDSDDVPPTRLEAAKRKLHDLVQRRAGARTGLIAYAGSAHLVLPVTDDPHLLDSFIEALSSELIETPGKDVPGVIGLARRLLAVEQGPGTLVLVTDGVDADQLPRIGPALAGAAPQVLILAVGTPASARFDVEGLERLAEAADAPLGSLTLDDDDLDWIELHAQRHFQAGEDDGAQPHWKDAGYWLCWPLLAIAFLCVRRGWSLHWLACLLLATSLAPLSTPVHAGPLADAFFTPDQQGRWAFERGDFQRAREAFRDPYWKGLAAYRAVDYQAAADSFAQAEGAHASFYLGNSYARLYKLTEAISAYQRALELQPVFPEARANLRLVTALRKDLEEQRQAAPEMAPDKIEFEQGADKGKETSMPAQQATSDELWLRNLNTSPAQFLKQKFRLQQAARNDTGEQP
ncbi:VWA domain-containing protein [Zestomonas carbonaria]|uniref:VWFA domain-containing protein n=1 Tax=Zestomonas carbonaria TaxID=2762745 RepID=A0A7U7ESF8_9GAMM|nr:VWA domain-containing protein [Pseudomonas carbonaria]CAD5109385.1 hypothetical protein PSEWESI4_03682 [Pseudomonas carbonaria]